MPTRTHSSTQRDRPKVRSPLSNGDTPNLITVSGPAQGEKQPILAHPWPQPCYDSSHPPSSGGSDSSVRDRVYPLGGFLSIGEDP
jgi:hypothetical protein